MSEITQLHRRAMELADEASAERRRGARDRALELTHKAFELERDAARETESLLEFEPTRSVLYRSAASLAMECGEFREAERLIGCALAGIPPEEVAEELRDLLEDVNFHRHLSLRGIMLQPDEFQLSIAGSAVGFGIAPMEYFLSRVHDVERLIYRTAERRRGRDFREAGRRKKELAEELELYVSVPRASSFAVSLRIGGPQLKLPGMDFPREVIDDLFDCFELLNAGNLQELEQRIHDESYLRNFIGLAEKIAPDGQKVRRVGFTAIRAEGERRIAITRTRERIRGAAIGEMPTETEALLEIYGALLEADARSQRQGRIEVVDEMGQTHRVIVPRGMMSDIVKPMFEESVRVTVRCKGKRLLLESIYPAD